MSADLLIVRHAEPDWEAEGAEETRNPPLSAAGREQAHLLGRWLAQNHQIASLYASPLRRARETAEIINQHLRLPVYYRDALQEWPRPGGVRTVLLQSQIPFDAEDPWEQRHHQQLPREYWDFAERIRRALREIVQAHQDQTVLVISHGGVVATAVRALIGGHRMGIRSDYTGVTRLVWCDDGLWEIDYLNRREHLSIGAQDRWPPG
jgi:probable phosphoglycerate mutase